MEIRCARPDTADIESVASALAQWQTDDGPFQLHPGDVGWFCRFGAATAAAALRAWRDESRVLAVGLLDGPTLLRLAIAPDARDDEYLARRIAEDIDSPQRGVLPGGAVSVEAPRGTRVRALLGEAGWDADEAWTPLGRDLTVPVEDPGIRTDLVRASTAHLRAAVQRAAFAGSTFTEDAWRAMADSPLYEDARCLVAFEATGAAVAIVTVWSAGPGRPGLIEPLGVHRDYRRRGYGTAIALAASAALREMGASRATVCTPSSNAAAIAAYVSAGLTSLPETHDLHRAR
ncbi:Acetyltransferase (GNAT) family protein [Paramicrobacterium humi]|uniref:Acetyltransferase (GNAT) family protein n=1 Tax=Paramicrobacterium humi TaxID=640635 RepID=A0A1H4IM76_9MICO|nr:GNAT family N-acetyltransferase [Microbacterium humi]SEB35179.1 Acetyltransferase (GNAT) family protein [Microbacterium humi]